MRIRSFAYGEDVHEAFVKWQKFFSDKKRIYGDGLVLSEQENIFGDVYRPTEPTLDKGLLPLKMEGNVLQLKADKYVWLNGVRSELYAGVDVKAGALLYFPYKETLVKGIAIIGRRSSDEGLQLRVYRFSKNKLEAHSFASVPLADTMDASSHIVCFGQHVFLVHNSTLDYYYLNMDEETLETVAIGADTENAQSEWCKFVNPALITTGDGKIFWIGENAVYGFAAGRPKNLICISCAPSKEIVHVRGDGNAVCVYQRDKNTKEVACVRYEPTENGGYQGRVVQNAYSGK